MTPERGIGILLAMVMVLGGGAEWHRMKKQRTDAATPAPAALAAPGSPVATAPVGAPPALADPASLVATAPVGAPPTLADPASLTALRLPASAPARAPATPHDG